MWEKKGVIYCPDGQQDWAQHSFMTPTPFQLNENTIRLYGGFRDNEGVSRIGYIDVDSNNPSKLLSVCKTPVLDIGKPGMFDDNGVILGDVIRVGNKVYMYYVGFQLVKKAKFLAFSGLAISDDNGENFTRYQQTPILDRSHDARTIQAIHSVHYDQVKNNFKVWFSRSIGEGWKIINDIPYPAYNIWYIESSNGIDFDKTAPILCIDCSEKEYRIGRPSVYEKNNRFTMLYTRDFVEKNYLVGMAYSSNGVIWDRKDEDFSLKKSSQGWDSEMLCYPVLHSFNDKKYMFYSGNDMGRTGVGYAVSS